MNEKLTVDTRPIRSGRRPTFNAIAPDGSPGCRVIAVVSEADHRLWEAYKYRLSVQNPGRVFSNDAAFAQLLKTIGI